MGGAGIADFALRVIGRFAFPIFAFCWCRAFAHPQRAPGTWPG